MRSAEHVAADGRDRRGRLARQATASSNVSAHVRLGDDLLNRRGMRADDAQHVADGNDARHAQRLARMIAVGAGIDHDEAAAAGIVLANERKAGGRLIVAFDDDVLEEVAEARFDGALVRLSTSR